MRAALACRRATAAGAEAVRFGCVGGEAAAEGARWGVRPGGFPAPDLEVLPPRIVLVSGPALDSFRWVGVGGGALYQGKPLADRGVHDVDDAPCVVLVLEGDFEVLYPLPA